MIGNSREGRKTSNKQSRETFMAILALRTFSRVIRSLITSLLAHGRLLFEFTSFNHYTKWGDVPQLHMNRTVENQIK